MNAFRTIVAALALGLSAMPAILTAREPVIATPDYSVGPQYNTTHVYVAVRDFDRFVASFIATFGGAPSKQGVFQVTPTPSKTKSQLVLTPAGTISVFGFLSPVPYPFGVERSGYLVTNIDAAVEAARRHGASRLIAAFPDPIGRDAVVQWPGGVNMQMYWHTAKPNYAPLATVPENRIYLTPDAADAFLASWRGFAHAVITDDARAADAAEIGQPGKTYRRVRLTSGYGSMVVSISDGQVPWPYGRELTGYEVSDLAATLAKATAAGAEILLPARIAGSRRFAFVRFPGGYIAELHAPAES